ncbi:MAG: hypothetical protein WCA34_12975, partial [Candidatus Acidiferrales bacterium]
GERHPRIIAIIIVLLQDDYVRFRKRFNDSPGDGGLARAGAAANADDQRPAIRRRKSRWRNGLLLAETLFSASSASLRSIQPVIRAIEYAPQ